MENNSKSEKGVAIYLIEKYNISHRETNDLMDAITRLEIRSHFKMVKEKTFKKPRNILFGLMMVFVTAVQFVLPANAMTVYESDGNYHDEGYIFIGESHSVIAAHAVGVKAAETENTFWYGGTEGLSFEYRWDSSLARTPDGSPNTFAMKGNLFFVFEGNAAGTDNTLQCSKQYIYSDGMGKRGTGVQKIHDIINGNPNIAHWNIISFHGAVSAAQGTREIANYYVNSYRNWMTYEFPEADCYFLSVATMTKYYKATSDKKVFNNMLAAAFPDRFFDYTDFYAARSSHRMIDTLHWDDPTYVELISDVLMKVDQKRLEKQVSEQPPEPATVEFTVTDVQSVLYTNDRTVIYGQPSLESSVLLASCDAGIPIQVTGITSNGFFRVCVSPDGAAAYIAGEGLMPMS